MCVLHSLCLLDDRVWVQLPPLAAAGLQQLSAALGPQPVGSVSSDVQSGRLVILAWLCSFDPWKLVLCALYVCRLNAVALLFVGTNAAHLMLFYYTRIYTVALFAAGKVLAADGVLK